MSKNNINLSKKKISYATLLLVAYDAIAVNLAYFLALWFRFDCRFSLMSDSRFFEPFVKFIPINTVFCVAVFFFLKLYQSLWRFASFNEFSRILVSSLITTILHSIGITLIFESMPLSYFLFGGLLQFCLLLVVRFAYRFVLLQRNNAKKRAEFINATRIMLVGAGVAGQMLLQDIKNSSESRGNVCCIIDDDNSKWGKYLDGVPIVGGRNDILENVDKYNVEKIYIAIPVFLQVSH